MTARDDILADHARLLDHASRVDVLDLAGRIIADPRRTAVSKSGELALAHGIERMWAICLEADLLVRALAMPESGDQEAMAVKDHVVQAQVDEVRRLMAELRGDTNTDKQETYNGSDDA